MPLTKRDTSHIKGIVHDEVENLARIVAGGFESVNKRLELIDKRLEKIDAEIRRINARLDIIEHDIAELRKNLINHNDEFADVLKRLARVEQKLGIKSK